MHLAVALDLLFGISLLAVLTFTAAKDPFVEGRGGFAASVLVALVWVALRFPIGFWSNYVHEKRWGFSTQTFGAWLLDAVKGSSISVVFMSMTAWYVIELASAFPRWWPVVTAVLMAAIMFVLHLLAPPLLERMFNRFAPLDDPALDEELRALAERAGSPVRSILVADASRRTTKVNAYVSGYGPLRRLVLFDTLVAKGDPREIKLVLAHELGHRRGRHVLKGVLLESLGTAALVCSLWALYRWTDVLDAIGATGPGDARTAPFILLVLVLGELAGLPVVTALSRRWERYADRFSLEVTDDPEAFEEAHRQLAASNLSELDPPRPLYLLLFTHPTPPERIDLARRWVAARAA